MELIFLIIGFLGGVAAMVLAIRRAKKKPEGKSAKTLTIMTGPGPWTPPK